MQSNTTWMGVAAIAGAVALCGIGCEKKSDPSLSQAAEKAASATKDTANKAGDAVKDAGAAVKDAAEKAEEAAKEAAPSGH